MSEIRDKAIIALQDLLGGCLDTEGTDECQHLTDQQVRHLIKAILSIPELAIVDRGTELPENPHRKTLELQPYLNNISHKAYKVSQQDILKAGWVKEVKDEASNTA